MQLDLHCRPSSGPPVRVGVAGVGEFGASLAARGRYQPQLSVDAFADLEVDAALARLQAAGIARDAVEVCDSLPRALAALRAGRKVLVSDAMLLVQLPLQVLVEATGHAEAAAACAEAAIAQGQHVVMVTKEADSVVGPLLHDLARRAGVVYTPVDGDQPSLLIKLVGWVQALGARIVAAGKASEYDFVYDPRAGTLASQGRTVQAPDLAGLWELGADGVATVAARAQALPQFVRVSVPDLCELGVVANATGLLPDVASMHAPIARTLELPDLFCPRADGGLFSREGVVDSFNCLRRPDELSFAGGVFVVADLGDDATFRVLQGKGIPASRQGSRLLLYNPTHLLGVEATISILSAAILQRSTLGDTVRPRVDLVARATRDLPAGTRLAIAHQHTHALADMQPLLMPAAPAALDDAAPLPYYMAVGQVLSRAVRAGEMLTAAALHKPVASALWRLRAAQDQRFLSKAPAGTVA
ncbi:MAG: hypothetical protein JWQ76_984 [Ramlibacter sp.]|nr:hypothetical protein [Ramlibacter sp.]